MKNVRTRWGVGVLVAVACALLFAPAHAHASAQAAPNSGEPGSRCEARRLGHLYTQPRAGVASSGLGPNPPAYYEVGQPTGAYATAMPNGVMMIIHGGGWFVVGKDSVSNVRHYTDSWRERGWLTVNIDYGACAKSVGDVVWFFDRIQERYPNDVICASGISAGGHLALLLASLRPGLACAIGLAAPTDLAPLERDQPKLYNLAVAAFGGNPRPPANRSPVHEAAKVRARVLLASSKADRAVPPSQTVRYGRALRAAHPEQYVDTRLLEPGPRSFVHAGISVRAWREWQAAEDALVAPWARPVVTAQRVG